MSTLTTSSNQADVYGIKFFIYGLVASFIIASSIVHLENDWDFIFHNHLMLNFALAILVIYTLYYVHLYISSSFSTFFAFNNLAPGFIQTRIASIRSRNKFPQTKELLLVSVYFAYKVYSFIASYCIIHLTLLVIDYISSNLYETQVENEIVDQYTPSDIERAFDPATGKLIEALSGEIITAISYFFVSFIILNIPAKYSNIKARLHKIFKIFLTVTVTIIALPILITIFTDMVTK